jgi:uncharacterized protein DUF5302
VDRKGETGMTEASKPADKEDEQHKLFREALERKKAAQKALHAEGVRNKGVGESHNDHHTRQFRRKSGS